MDNKELSEKKCVPCEGGVARFNKEQIKTYMAALEGDWEVEEGTIISREFEFENFVEAMDFANKITTLAEEEGHHPDLHIYYGRCVVDLWTHAIGGLSENDFIMASKIDLLYSK